MPEYRHKKQYSGKKLAESKTSSLVADYINLSSHGSICFANLHLKDLTERCYGFNCIINPQQVFFESLISFCKRKTRYSLEYLVPLWQRYKDSNLKWRSQRLAIFFQNRLFKPFFRLCVSQKSLRILFLLSTANSYEELRTLHWGVERSSKSTLSFTVG